MHRTEDTDQPVTDDALLFEYVLGTLPDAERKHLEQRMKSEPVLEAKRWFWEENLFQLNNPELVREPASTTWSAIERSLPHHDHNAPVTLAERFWRWFPWSLTSFALLLMMAVLLNTHILRSPEAVFTTDYIAILADDSGDVKLTTLGSGDARALRLRWSSVEVPDQQVLQIWARSKTDGEIRSLAVINDSELTEIALSDATWRLIKDAHSLILTLEEQGGSPIDQPSDRVLAKGACVRLTDV